MKNEMKKTRTIPKPPRRWYRGTEVSMPMIRRFARQVVERFKPDKIILFGSHAYGTPHADSDVDILVVMPARNELDRAVRIRLTIDYNFPLDLIVRTPQNLAWRLAEGDSFLREIVNRGRILYEKDDGRVGPQSRGRLLRRENEHSSENLPQRRLQCWILEGISQSHRSLGNHALPGDDQSRCLADHHS